MAWPRYSLMTLLIVSTLLSFYFGIAKSSPLLALAIAGFTMVLAMQAGVIVLLSVDSFSSKVRRTLLLIGTLLGLAASAFLLADALN